MSKINVSFKAAAFSTVAALALAALAVTSAFAASPAPTATSTQPTSASLQKEWKAESSSLNFDADILARYEKIFGDSRGIRNGDLHLAGLNSVTVGEFNKIVSQAQALISSHPGFDATGAVTDAAQAQTTIKTLGGYLSQLRTDFIGLMRYDIRADLRFVS